MKSKFCVTREGLPFYSVAEGVTICHLGDLHEAVYGYKNEELAVAVLEGRPDALLITGDVFDKYREDGTPFLDFLSCLKSRVPVYMCLGNHEIQSRERCYPNITRFLDEVQKKGVVVLENRFVQLCLKGQTILLYGLNTYTKKRRPKQEDVRRFIGECPKSGNVIVLAHDPKWFPALADWGADIVLAGHTHGGFCRLPNGKGIAAPGFIPFPRYDSGVFVRGKTVMYITRGFGKSKLGFRIHNLPELAFLTLAPEIDPLAFKCRHERDSNITTMLKCALSAFLILLSVWCLLAMMDSSPSPFIYGPAAVTTLLMPVLWRWDLIRQHLPRALAKVISTTFFMACACAFLFCGYVTCRMFVAASHPAFTSDATVVVLGGKVNPSGPSRSVKARLDCAVEYLNEHPEAPCIVTGGKSDDWTTLEAVVMTKYLKDKGIAGYRIYMEPAAENTYENILLSAELIEQYALPERMVIVSDGYHQYRAERLAQKLGIESSPCSCRTPFSQMGVYWAREILAVARSFLLYGF